MTGVFAYNVFFFLGMKTLTAGRTLLIMATNPVFIALLSALLFRERLHSGKVTGIILCLCGTTIVISWENPIALFTGGAGWGELYHGLRRELGRLQADREGDHKGFHAARDHVLVCPNRRGSIWYDTMDSA